MKAKFFILCLSIGIIFFTSCKREKKVNNNLKPTSVEYNEVRIPEFNADSAFQYVVNQVQCGFRHPGSKGHDKCANYLYETMQQWCDTVILQPFTTTLWNGSSVHGVNIIASLLPERNDRILLAAHWDSRQWADQDKDSTNWHKPLLGANDGASGVATLMEMARIMSEFLPNVGIDFVFFDVEDQGLPSWENRYEDNTWCKGSQYWAQHPHRLFYTAHYGILYDMVGTQNPRFTKEEVSVSFAPGVVKKFWHCAAYLGYASIFVDELSSAILDDHLYVNQILRIPTIDIVQNDPKSNFFNCWHTVDDNLEAVDAQTMKTVASVTMKMIYGDYPHAE